MFWSPAVTRFSVTGCCAATGKASVSPASIMVMMPSPLMATPLTRDSVHQGLSASSVESSTCTAAEDSSQLARPSPNPEQTAYYTDDSAHYAIAAGTDAERY